MNAINIHTYSESIRRLRDQCLSEGITEDEFREMYLESLNSLQYVNEPTMENLPPPRNKPFLYGLLVVTVLIFAYNYSAIYACLLCNLQEYIYPGLKLLRRISIPFISLFPSLTGLYHETCLIQNPFFSVADMDCFPCTLVTNVREIIDPKPVTQQPAAPFIYESHQVTNVKELNQFYLKYKNELDKESNLIAKYASQYGKASEMFKDLKSSKKDTYIWKFNTMNGARVLRQLIPRPKVVPKFGQSTERFLMIDSSLKSFQVPDTECSNAFLLALSGKRKVQLKPADECLNQCKSLNVDLKESFLLWYNWWYWRPVIQATNGNDTFIGHVGSYC